ncbi:MAG: hypothetical protein OES27_09395 [Nitrosopumilus sp.]|nr:hypothetical protein [Nitrosopumilus sp.]
MEEGLTLNIETMKQVQRECWRRYNDRCPTKRAKWLSLIKDSSVSLDKFYRSIQSLEKMKKESEHAKQKLGKIKATAQTVIAGHAIPNTG